MSHPVLNDPFEKIGADIQRVFLLVVDYFLKFLFVFELYDEAVFSIIRSLKLLCSIHGVPETLFADNMPLQHRKF